MKHKSIVKKKEVPTFVPKPMGRILDAGGGAGRAGLTYSELKKGQDAMFQRSLDLSYLMQLDKEQSIRQTTIVEEKKTVRVMVAREDYLEVEAPFVVTYLPSTSQASWAKFILDVGEKLKINFLEVIVDRKDYVQVHCILSLREGGYYLARQRESSAVMDTISTGKNPTQVYWQITKNITAVKAELIENLATKDEIEKRSVELIQKPIVCKLERDTYTKLLDCSYSDNIVQTIRDAIEIANGGDANKQMSLTSLSAMATNSVPSETAADTETGRVPQPDDPPDFEFKPLKFNENELDVVNLVRLGYESLSRIIFKGKWAAKEVASQAAEFIFTNLIKYIAEVDIVVVGLKLINDVIAELNSAKFVIFKICLDAIEFYAPPAPPHRPRPVPKSRDIVNQLATSMLELLGGKDGAGNAAGESAKANIVESGKSKKDGRGRAELAKPNIKELLSGKGKVAVVANEPIDVAGILSKHTTGLPIITSRPTSRPTSRNSKVDMESEPPPIDVIGSLPYLPTVSFTHDSAAEPLEDQAEGFRLARSISKGHMVSKKDWKGTSGKIGKKFVDESSLEFQMKLMAERGELGGDEIMKAVDGAKSKRIKRPKAIIRPRMFRGFTGNMKNNMALLQAFVTLFYLVTRSPKNKEFAFHINLQDEISHIALVSQAFPQVLEYIIWIIDAMYSERVVLEDFEDDLSSNPHSMQLSHDSVFAKTRTSALTKSYIQRKQATAAVHEADLARAVAVEAVDDAADDDECESEYAEAPLPLLTGMEWEVLSDITAPTVATKASLHSTDVYIEGDAEIEETEGMRIARQKLLQKEEEAEADLPDFEGGTVSLVIEDKKQLAKRLGHSGLTEKEQRKAERAAARANRQDEEPSSGGARPTSGHDRPVSGRERPGSGTGRPVSATRSAVVNPRFVCGRGGEEGSEKPFMAQPHEIVIVAVAMIGAHVEINVKEKQVTSRWLTLWDDGTQEYQLKVRLGMSLSSA